VAPLPLCIHEKCQARVVVLVTQHGPLRPAFA
jgi:hypothetical protein